MESHVWFDGFLRLAMILDGDYEGGCKVKFIADDYEKGHGEQYELYTPYFLGKYLFEFTGNNRVPEYGEYYFEELTGEAFICLVHGYPLEHYILKAIDKMPEIREPK